MCQALTPLVLFVVECRIIASTTNQLTSLQKIDAYSNSRQGVQRNRKGQ